MTEISCFSCMKGVSRKVIHSNNQSEGVNIAMVSICNNESRVFNDHTLAVSPRLTAGVRVFTGELNEPISEVSVVLDRGPAVVDRIRVEHSRDLLRVELSAKEWVVWTLHSGHENVSRDRVSAGGSGREHGSQALVLGEGRQGQAPAVMIESHGLRGVVGHISHC